MKTCTKCSKEQELKQYSKKTKSPDGLYPQCKSCRSEESKLHYEANKDRKKANAAKYYENNKQHVLNRRANDESIKEYNKQWRSENVEKAKQYQKKYNEENIDKIVIQRKNYRKENRPQLREYSTKYFKDNPEAKLTKNLRKRISSVLFSKGGHKVDSYTKSIGCDQEFLKKHIESLFEPGMTWDNYGINENEWTVDHRIPLTKGNTPEQIYELNHYLNLVPMWAKENFSKNNLRSDVCWQKLKRDKLNEEDKATGFNFSLSAADFTLSNESITKEHRDFIERYEWLGSCGFGVRQVFTARHEGKLAGVVMMAEPNGYQFDKTLECLIQRGACSSWAPKNLNSRLVMFACKWMVQNTTKRIFVAYSDPDAGEIGTIYQACNFDYLGKDFGSTKMYLLSNGKTVTDRHFTRTSSMKKHCKELGIEWQSTWTKENGFQNVSAIPDYVKDIVHKHITSLKSELKIVNKPKKGKYVLLLKKDKREKLEKTWESKPYPKRD